MYLLYTLYYTVMASTTPMGKKTIIVGTIVYFFLPTDLIPDILPIIGVADDFGAIIAGISAVVSCSTPEIVSKAKAKAQLSE